MSLSQYQRSSLGREAESCSWKKSIASSSLPSPSKSHFVTLHALSSPSAYLISGIDPVVGVLIVINNEDSHSVVGFSVRENFIHERGLVYYVSVKISCRDSCSAITVAVVKELPAVAVSALNAEVFSAGIACFVPVGREEPEVEKLRFGTLWSR